MIKRVELWHVVLAGSVVVFIGLMLILARASKMGEEEFQRIKKKWIEEERRKVAKNLKPQPCPFCGEEKDLIVDRFHVYCDWCGASGPQGLKRDESIILWNQAPKIAKKPGKK